MSSTAELRQLAATKFGLEQPGGPRVLENHPAQNAVAINGWGSVLFGLPFMFVGAFPWLMAPHAHLARNHAPDWLGYFICAVFFFPGLFFFVHGLRGAVRKAAWKRAAASHPNDPWVYDFHWHREGIAFSAFDEMVKRLSAAVGWTAFVVFFAWLGMRGLLPFLFGAILFGLFGLVFWYRWAVMLLELLRYGNGYLSYESFPYALGGTLRAQLRPPRHFSMIDELTLTLRCVQEKYVTTGAGQNRSTQVVCYELYKDASTLDRDRLSGLAGGPIQVNFPIPPDQPATMLAATPPTYWEIAAKGKAPGADYEALFLVPIYKV